MPALLELQRAFAASMLHEEDDAVCGAVVDDGFAAAERLRIYRNTCRSTLIEALRMTYPAVERLVGRDFFDMAAARYAGTHPPQSGYLNEYGGEFPEFLAAFAPASELRYLADSRALRMGARRGRECGRRAGPRPAHTGGGGSAKPRGAAFRASPLGELPYLGLSGRPD